MFTVKITAKRQATLPKRVCDSLSLKPGDELKLERTVVNNRESWILRPARPLNREWIGSLRDYAGQKSHKMSDIRANIAKKRTVNEK
ncbi:MAG: AbrB/MazE/SpoVT family DNA-binding domain-containing protein [Opitutales bacterium]|nr:AbrB/MazE/SpoVT family DNA-binding domain-containing protein [Opitutales bacterium]MCH8541798.1 AbrB/MazE/SpoVT family DNA-binding domain-containing protein [Opitutales bacterium]